MNNIIATINDAENDDKYMFCIGSLRSVDVPYFKVIVVSTFGDDNFTIKESDIALFSNSYIATNHESVNILYDYELEFINNHLKDTYFGEYTLWDCLVNTWDMIFPGNAMKYPQYRNTITQPDYSSITNFVNL